jgi:leucyl-tRNA synthetase
MIRAFAYRDSRGIPTGYEDIDFREDGAIHKATGEKLHASVEKMSKSLKNVINPEQVVNEYGADSLRLYEMFMGPLEASKPWNPRDVPGVFRFLQRVWRLLIDENSGGLSSYVVEPSRDANPSRDREGAGSATDSLERLLHKTIKKVGEDVERLAFNTGISAMMEFVNEAYRAKSIRMDQAERFVMVLSAFAPFIAEELWQRVRGPAWKTSIAYEPWPTFDPKLVEDDEVEIPVQVNGKLASRLVVSKSAPQDAVQTAAMGDPKVAEKLAGKPVVKAIYVPGRMLNLVV